MEKESDQKLRDNVLKIVETLDGSHTIYVPNIDEHYHSINGAINESLHVYVKAGFNFINKETIRVCEVGFGTGLNAFLTWIDSKSKNKQVYYYALEPFPLDWALTCKLNYPSILNAEGGKEIFYKMHNCEWNRSIQLSDKFQFIKSKGKIKEIREDQRFDVIYFDAFSPRCEGELWNEDVFKILNSLLFKDGVLVTYSSNGKFKRDLKAAHFKVFSLPGPVGKREITRGIKIEANKEVRKPC